MKNDLVSIDRSLKKLDPLADDFNVIPYIRIVFADRFCAFRKVYWYETKWGRTILRQVKKDKRTSKSEDGVVSTFSGNSDHDVMRLIIANQNSSKIMTGIRWELYNQFDFESALPQEIGRFDHFDLLGRTNPEKLKYLINSGLSSLNPAAWDFDGMLLSHTCPSCKQKIIGKAFIVFYPSWMECSCGYRGDLMPCLRQENSKERDIAQKMFHETLMSTETMLRKAKDGVKDVLMAKSQLPQKWYAISLVDLFITPILCWLMENGQASGYSPFACGSQAQLWLLECFPHTIFRRLCLKPLLDIFLELVSCYHDYQIEEAKRGKGFIRLPDISFEECQRYHIKEQQQQKEISLENVKKISAFEAWFLEKLKQVRKHQINKLIDQEISEMQSALKELPRLIIDLVGFVGEQLTESKGVKT